MLNVIEIKDFNAPELDIYARCTEARLLNKDHPEEGMFIAESPKVIGRALDAGYEPLSVLVEKKQMEENEETSQIMNRFDDTKVSIFTADFEVLTKLTGFKLTRGMLCAMRRKPLRKFQDLCDGINRIAILENVQNPTNVGAIFRSAAALLTIPGLHQVFKVETLNFEQLGTVYLYAFACFPIIQLLKWVRGKLSE